MWCSHWQLAMEPVNVYLHVYTCLNWYIITYMHASFVHIMLCIDLVCNMKYYTNKVLLMITIVYTTSKLLMDYSKNHM